MHSKGVKYAWRRLESPKGWLNILQELLKFRSRHIQAYSNDKKAGLRNWAT